MKFVNIPSSQLPEIDPFVKECINQGQWTLFKAEKGEIDDRMVVFFLKAGKDFFALNNTGKVISVFQTLNHEPEMNEVIHFSDIPKPESLSNIASLRFARV